jgi:hypothetical protein
MVEEIPSRQAKDMLSSISCDCTARRTSSAIRPRTLASPRCFNDLLNRRPSRMASIQRLQVVSEFRILRALRYKLSNDLVLARALRKDSARDVVMDVAWRTKHFNEQLDATPSSITLAVDGLIERQSNLRHATRTQSKITERASSILPRQFIILIRSTFRPFREVSICLMSTSEKQTSMNDRVPMDLSVFASRSDRFVSPDIHIFLQQYRVTARQRKLGGKWKRFDCEWIIA